MISGNFLLCFNFHRLHMTEIGMHRSMVGSIACNSNVYTNMCIICGLLF